MSPVRSELFGFFRALDENNQREWFLANKGRYEADVKEPLLSLIADFAAPLSRISPHFRAIPKVGGSLFRIYRDVRFSKDKRPYKTAAGVHFRHEARKSAHAPGFYLHLGPDEVFAAVGIWGPDTRTLGRIRRAIVDTPDAWEDVTTDEAFTETFTQALQSDSLKRAPRGFDPNHRFIDDLRRRHHVASAPLTEDDACRAGFPERLAGIYRAGAPYMEFLTRAVGLPW